MENQEIVCGEKTKKLQKRILNVFSFGDKIAKGRLNLSLDQQGTVGHIKINFI